MEEKVCAYCGEGFRQRRFERDERFALRETCTSGCANLLGAKRFLESLPPSRADLPDLPGLVAESKPVTRRVRRGRALVGPPIPPPVPSESRRLFMAHEKIKRERRPTRHVIRATQE